MPLTQRPQRYAKTAEITFQFRALPRSFGHKKLTRFLEAQLAGELNAARVVRDAVVDAAEDRRGDDGGRIIKRRVVQDVARVESQIETHALRDSELLRERRIPLKVVRREEEVASSVSDRAGSGRGKLAARRLVKPEIPASLQH